MVSLPYSVALSPAHDTMVSCASSTLLLLLLASVHVEPKTGFANLCDSTWELDPIKVKGKLLHRAIISKLFKKPQSLNVTMTGADSQFQSTPTDLTNILDLLPKSQECSFATTPAGVCDWVYRCDADEQRIPQNLIQAELSMRTSQSLVFVHENAGERLECSCEPITTPINVLRFHDCVEGKEEWRWETSRVTVAFTCAFHI